MGRAGPAGPAGPTGAMGQRGATGPQGPPGFSDLELVTKESPFDSEETKVVVAACPLGKTAISGGGVVIEAPEADIALTDTRKTGVQTWRVQAEELDSDGGTWRLTAQAVCAETE